MHDNRCVRVGYPLLLVIASIDDCVSCADL
jgi:hypothetical protein